MESLSSLYRDHIATLQQRTREILQRQQLEGLLIHAGEPISRFLDDHDYPFKVNPQFKAWFPVTRVPHCWLWVDGVNKPKLWYYLSIDYWYLVEPLPDSFWTPYVDIVPFADPDEIAALLPPRDNVAYLGSSPHRASLLGMERDFINPQPVLDYLHYHRAYKTDYELACMREAQKSAVNGHRAAKEAFLSGMCEFDINIAYLSACGHRDTDVPYDNIIALNEHAAVLHYTRLDQHTPEHVMSFLIDAGTEYNGYAADLTRTYAAQKDSDFAALIAAMNSEQQALIATIETGVNYIDYHLQMHGRIAKLLKQFDILSGLSEDAMVTEGLTLPFLPHGLGHPLGLQVHDVAGFMQDDRGTSLAPQSRYTHLRCTRVLQPRMVLTIEPGLYFIESLLAPWRANTFGRHFNWSRIESFKPYGGIRIEDNIVIHDNHIENMTRALKLE
ncbi:Xaa-Pro dipeptidase [Sodalis glossinidius str. 'morsitans']|uniref:Xaa-Pro dipeptidase n=2 Tax=Sodalis glossinidius (strain morsitans) TaxID=343509 RepID=PEPQ_SODGM|nr:Xaa-Pro dipeptidase [Sodalis glossinidius]Q2NWT2.1 RecName: Full=Xaa-Pro dipeptidase; Short=X-Pro dipeptidase; AltName: Full=Imidodipeptidase; AltName: Full=Proline dipeptidase; Short=Prolidase [Sodalis glossinidius str. 'morsitans']BAE73393.1 proline dipeptidase [Sodalis glossinidius str. 'morsitans']CRL43738.1 Xaa-Pro dipeptidase [Sodalis glossinidius str. 'morsitans']